MKFSRKLGDGGPNLECPEIWWVKMFESMNTLEPPGQPAESHSLPAFGCLYNILNDRIPNIRNGKE